MVGMCLIIMYTAVCRVAGRQRQTTRGKIIAWVVCERPRRKSEEHILSRLLNLCMTLTYPRVHSRGVHTFHACRLTLRLGSPVSIMSDWYEGTEANCRLQPGTSLTARSHRYVWFGPTSSPPHITVHIPLVASSNHHGRRERPQNC